MENIEQRLTRVSDMLKDIPEEQQVGFCIGLEMLASYYLRVHKKNEVVICHDSAE